MTVLGEFSPALTEQLQHTFGILRTCEVVITEERAAHIRSHHPQDYALFLQYGCDAVFSPDLLVQDEKNTGTVFAIKRLPETNLNVVVRLVLEADDPSYKNSVMTFYRIRERNLRKLLEKNRLLYTRD